MLNHAETLYKLLDGLGEVPEQPKHVPDWGWSLPGIVITEDIALAILRDKARRVCDDRMVWIDKTDDSGEYAYEIRWGEERGVVLYEPTYEEALIAGLEWVKENRNG